MRTATAIAVLMVTASAWAQQYETHDGCDAGRWSEWESIIIGFEGDVVEQGDARNVRNINRQLCARMEAGEVTQEEADRLYQVELDAWTRRIEQRRKQRKKPGGSGSVGFVLVDFTHHADAKI